MRVWTTRYGIPYRTPYADTGVTAVAAHPLTRTATAHRATPPQAAGGAPGRAASVVSSHVSYTVEGACTYGVR